MRYFCKRCKKVLTQDDVVEETIIERDAYAGAPFSYKYSSRYCCYCDGEDLETIDTSKIVYVVKDRWFTA